MKALIALLLLAMLLLPLLAGIGRLRRLPPPSDPSEDEAGPPS